VPRQGAGAPVNPSPPPPPPPLPLLLLQPEAVARELLDGVTRWRFFISVGFDGWMLSTLTAGMAPASTLLTGLVQVRARVGRGGGDTALLPSGLLGACLAHPLRPLLQVLTMGFWRCIGLFYIAYFYHAVAAANPQAPEARRGGGARASPSSGSSSGGKPLGGSATSGLAESTELSSSALQAGLVENEHS
jgi:hypothetical protein